MQNMLIRAALATLVVLGAAGTAYAEGLPPLPHSGPAAKASARGDSGGALEPYLITLLLPFGGVVMAVAGISLDKRLRAAGHG